MLGKIELSPSIYSFICLIISSTTNYNTAFGLTITRSGSTAHAGRPHTSGGIYPLSGVYRPEAGVLMWTNCVVGTLFDYKTPQPATLDDNHHVQNAQKKVKKAIPAMNSCFVQARDAMTSCLSSKHPEDDRLGHPPVGRACDRTRYQPCHTKFSASQPTRRSSDNANKATTVV